MVKAKTTRKRQTKAKKAGLVFPVSRFHRMLRASQSNRVRVSAGASVYAAAVAEYMVAELAEMAGNACRQMTQKRISPRHIMLAIKNDEEMHNLLKNVNLPASGVVPYINPKLLSAKQLAAVTKPPHKPAPKPSVVAAAKKLPQGKVLAQSRKQPRGAGKGIVTLTERILTNGNKLTVLAGDITSIQADAFLIPTASNFTLNGQVGNRACVVGGAGFQKNIAKIGGNLPLAQAAVCRGVNFASPYVILSNGPTWNANPSSKAVKDLVRTVQNALELGEQNGFQSIALPSIGSGNASFPKHIAAQTILKTISDYFKAHENSKIDNVYFVLFDQESIDTYVREVGLMHE